MGIKKILRDSYRKKVNVKIKYYSRLSDEVKWRILSIYRLEPDFLIAFCHLRKEERTFVIDRIRNARILEEPYQIPKDWKPKSIVWINKCRP